MKNWKIEITQMDNGFTLVVVDTTTWDSAKTIHQTVASLMDALKISVKGIKDNYLSLPVSSDF